MVDGPVVGVDLGGTKILGALVDAAGSLAPTVAAEVKRSTPTLSAEAVIDELVSVIGSLDPDPVAVGIGTPGVVVPGTGVVQVAPNLPGFDRPMPLGALLRERLGVPVVVGNDVNMAAYGEARAGAAAGHPDVLAVWMGTGLGAGLVLDGRLRVGASGLAGELGHVIVVPGGRRCGCGGRGHLEAYIGRRAMEERARELHDNGRPTGLVDLVGPKRMKSSAFRAAYDDGDEVATELIDEGLEMLGVAVANVVVTVDVSTVVLGGGLGERLGAIAVDRLTASLAALRFAGEPPAVVSASLGDHSGAIGAAALAALEAS
ncbi:MAG: ROK family protein [Acidimicrobiales bacterium]